MILISHNFADIFYLWLPLPIDIRDSQIGCNAALILRHSPSLRFLHRGKITICWLWGMIVSKFDIRLFGMLQDTNILFLPITWLQWNSSYNTLICSTKECGVNLYTVKWILCALVLISPCSPNWNWANSNTMAKHSFSYGMYSLYKNWANSSKAGATEAIYQRMK